MILSNAAASELAMDLNRRCLKTCDLALSKDPMCLKAHLIKGKVQLNMGKTARALTSWKNAISNNANIEPHVDIDTLNKILHEIKSLESPQEVSSTLSTTPSPSPSSLPRNEEASAIASMVSPPMPPSQQPPKDSVRDSLRKEALAAPVAASALAAALQVAKASGIREDSPALLVTEHMLAQARSVLSHSSGIASLDNAIARGYLFVNTGM
jgi:hypothetical protein